MQTTDSIKTALLHPFFILRVVRLQRYGSENQKSKHGLFGFFLPYHTTWEFQQQQTKFTHCINSCTVNQICTFIVLAMHFECKYCWDLYKSWQILITRAQKTFLHVSHNVWIMKTPNNHGRSSCYKAFYQSK